MYIYCPRDNFALSIKNNDGSDLFQCAHCHGLWISKKSLLSLAARRQIPTITKHLESETLPLHFTKGILTCPADKTPMHFHSIGMVEVDLCSSCHGVWLDRGELETLPRERPSSSSTATSELVSTSLDVLIHLPAVAPDLVQSSVELGGEAISGGADILGNLLGAIAEALLNG